MPLPAEAKDNIVPDLTEKQIIILYPSQVKVPTQISLENN